MALRLLGIIVTESARNAVSAIRALNARALCLLGVQGLLLEFLDVIFLAFSFLAFLLLALRAKYTVSPLQNTSQSLLHSSHQHQRYV